MENVFKKGSAWRKTEADEIRRQRKLLRSPDPEDELQCRGFGWIGAVLVSLLLWSVLLLVFCVFSVKANASEVWSDEAIVNAIYKAENSKSHPYGIMKKYKTTTPRQACFNTVRNKRKQWVKDGAKGDFIRYLASKYAPIGADNDPTNLNKNWEKNVRFFLAKGMR